MSITRVGQKEKGNIGATKITQVQREGIEKGGREKKRKKKKGGGKEKEVKINHYPKRA